MHKLAFNEPVYAVNETSSYPIYRYHIYKKENLMQLLATTAWHNTFKQDVTLTPLFRKKLMQFRLPSQ